MALEEYNYFSGKMKINQGYHCKESKIIENYDNTANIFDK